MDPIQPVGPRPPGVLPVTHARVKDRERKRREPSRDQPGDRFTRQAGEGRQAGDHQPENRQVGDQQAGGQQAGDRQQGDRQPGEHTAVGDPGGLPTRIDIRA